MPRKKIYTIRSIAILTMITPLRNSSATLGICLDDWHSGGRIGTINRSEQNS